MHNKSILLTILAMIGFALQSCAPDPIYSYPPEYERVVRFTKDDPKTIKLDNQSNINFVSTCQAGDSITALIRVTYSGAYITEAIYYWTLKDASGNTIKEESIGQIAPHKQSTPPMWSFEAPSSGTYYVHFRARFEASAKFENGSLVGGYPTSANYEGANTVKAVLTVK